MQMMGIINVLITVIFIERLPQIITQHHEIHLRIDRITDISRTIVLARTIKCKILAPPVIDSGDTITNTKKS